MRCIVPNQKVSRSDNFQISFIDHVDLATLSALTPGSPPVLPVYALLIIELSIDNSVEPERRVVSFKNIYRCVVKDNRTRVVIAFCFTTAGNA
jgi:hypothetical protein